jgi:hypothetical protein
MNTLTTRRAYRSARRRRAVLKAVLSGVIATVIAVILAVAGSGATFAILSSQTVAMPATSITAGTAAINVSKPSAFTLLMPGAAQARSVTVTNTSDTALDLTVESATFTGTLAASTTVALRSNAATCDATSGTAIWTRTPASTPSGAIGVRLAAGATTTLCLTMTVAADAPASAAASTMAASITVGGKQP